LSRRLTDLAFEIDSSVERDEECGQVELGIDQVGDDVPRIRERPEQDAGDDSAGSGESVGADDHFNQSVEDSEFVERNAISASAELWQGMDVAVTYELVCRSPV